MDETLAEIRDSVQRIGATRVVIDSLSGFEIALAPAFREDFRESLYRLVGALTATGVTVFMTSEMVGGYPDPHITSERVSFITDDIFLQRFIEVDGQLRKVLSVVKMRGSDHSHDFRLYDITENGAVVGGPLNDYRGIITGVPQFQLRLAQIGYAGLTEQEGLVLDALIRIGRSNTETLSTRTGISVPDLASVLDRVVQMGYATVANGTFEAVARIGQA